MVVYPHWRGELEPCQNGASFVPGLSPLPRGTRFAGRYHRAGKRFIPAGAGNSTVRACSSIAPTVYPRWRGELFFHFQRFGVDCGLSPLARGTRLTILVRNNQRRFIPAGAGNSRSAAFPHASRSVYPRWRGELSKHNLLLINDFLSQSQSTNFTVSHKQHIHYVKERLIH